MAIQRFIWKYYNWTTKYQPANYVTQFGGGWPYASKQIAPHQRIFTLTFESMCYLLLDQGVGYIDTETDKDRNLGALNEFYREHSLAVPFVWEHPAEGDITVKFKEPIELPEMRENIGWSEQIKVTLIEIPELFPAYKVSGSGNTIIDGGYY